MACPTSDRRRFLKTTAALGAGYWVAGGLAAQESNSPNERLRMACIGVAGKGGGDSNDAATFGDVVAICDVDEQRLESRAQGPFEKSARFTDFRKMFDKMGSGIDAVTISTPDHNHAPAALMAMRLGKHCFCQKPLTRTVYEARLMSQVAREQNVATQMGNQGTADPHLRRAAAWLRAGVLGTVREVHVWTNRPIWPQGIPRPEPATCPSSLHWDEWIGPAPMRPYAQRFYHDFAWRGWWDFGTGALGDMACHEINMAFMGLDLRDPLSFQAETSGHNHDSLPQKSTVTYEFAANSWRPAVKLVWYDGGHRPPADVCDGRDPGEDGQLVIGDKGRLWGYRELTGDVQAQDVPIVTSPGHFAEWVAAIRGGAPAMSNFPDYAGPLTEVVLAGNLAVWLADQEGAGPQVQWDARNMQATNVEGLESLIKPTYRAGYTLDV
ncbi:MAG: Gfo/Idh/MocA family protein [Pirellulaceae bacterium]